MDSEWLNRAGILAEAVSFLLIAPEIIGQERVGRIEVAIKSWSERSLRGPRRIFTPGSVIKIVPGMYREALDHPLVTIAEMGAVLALHYAIILTTICFGIASAILTVFVAGSMIGAVMGVGLIRLFEKNRMVRVLAYTLAIPAVPVSWLLVVLSMGLYLILQGGIRLFSRLLIGDNRLRALVFGTGVLLLFGGMTSQFVATF